MKTKLSPITVLVMCLAAGAAAQTPLGTAFTYQGQLKDGGSPAFGSFDLQFTLYGVETGGSIVAGPTCADNVPVQDGLFTVEVDFGSPAFNGHARWLEIGVLADSTADNCDADAHPYLTLSPRQSLTATPYALHALDAPAGHSLDAADGSPVDAVFVDNDGNVGIGTTNPTQALEVLGQVKIRDAFGQAGTGALTYVNDTGSMFIGPESGGSVNGSIISLAGPLDTLSGVPGGIRFNTTGASPAMVITSGSGNVGIGVANPEELLHVGNGTAGETIQIGAYTAIGEQDSSGATVVGDNTKPADSPEDGMVYMQTHPSYGARAIVMNFLEGITFHAQSGSVTAGDPFANETMRITNSGKVGIGAASPPAKLTVQAPSSPTQTDFTMAVDSAGILISTDAPPPRVSAVGAYTPGIFWRNSDSGPGLPIAGIYLEESLDSLGQGREFFKMASMHFGTSRELVPFGGEPVEGITNDAMVIDPDGNVGIGTTSPNQKLDVTGTAAMTGFILHGNGAAVDRVLTSNAFGVGSWKPAPGANAWTLSGNGNTMPDTNFLGTTDDKALEFKVNGQRALRLEPNATSPNVIGGFSGNAATNSFGVIGATISGGGAAANTNRVLDDYGTIGGGSKNTAGNGDSAVYATIAGGLNNTASAYASTVAGGNSNTGSGQYGVVGGGQTNTASGDVSIVGGGIFNIASASGSTIGGGSFNSSSGALSTVAGGQENVASGFWSGVAGGHSNTASNTNAFVGGGLNNTALGLSSMVGSGVGNLASGDDSIVGGGTQNTASGTGSMVPGGQQNVAQGTRSFAAGFRAKANHSGAFVWGDNFTFSDVASTANNQFIVRASGGLWFGTNSSPSIAVGQFINTSTGAFLSTGGTWTNNSDRSAKKNLIPVDAREALERVSRLPISTWNYKAEDDSIRHMGPMAQDFHAAFKLGDGDTSIGTIDADGVALAAIQGLNQIVKEKDGRIEALETKNADLAGRLARLEAAVDKLAGQEKAGE